MCGQGRTETSPRKKTKADCMGTKGKSLITRDDSSGIGRKQATGLVHSTHALENKTAEKKGVNRQGGGGFSGVNHSKKEHGG